MALGIIFIDKTNQSEKRKDINKMNQKTCYSLKPETVARIEELARKLDRKKSNIIDIAVETLERKVNENFIID